jgi:hypothetical protein
MFIGLKVVKKNFSECLTHGYKVNLETEKAVVVLTVGCYFRLDRSLDGFLQLCGSALAPG